MDFEFSADQELLRDTVRRFLAERAPISPYVRAMLDDRAAPAPTSGRARRPRRHRAARARADGGAGHGHGRPRGGRSRRWAAAVHPGPFPASAVGAASLVTLAGPDAVRGTLLPGLAAGRAVGTVALDEPGHRGAWRRPADARRRGRRRLGAHGTKAHVPDARRAPTSCSSSPAPTPSSASFARRRRRTADVAVTAHADRRRHPQGRHGRAPRTPAARVGSGDATAAVRRDGRPARRSRWWSTASGAASRALELAVEYAKERQQFAQPIGSFQAVQHLCADMLRAVELGPRRRRTTRAGPATRPTPTSATAPRRWRGRSPPTASTASARPRSRCFGGVGFTWEHDIHLFYKRLLTLQHAGGGATDQLEELAALVLDSPAVDSHASIRRPDCSHGTQPHNATTPTAASTTIIGSAGRGSACRRRRARPRP